MADLFTSEQGKRLFGFIGAGGTAGALLGPVITIALSVPLGPHNLLIAAIVFLEAAVFCAHRLERSAGAKAAVERPGIEARVGGGAFAGLSAAALALPARRRRLGQPAVLRRDDALLHAGQRGGRDGAGGGCADADLRQHRPGGGAADAGDAGLRHRPPAPAFRHRRWRRRRCRRSTSSASSALALAPTLAVVLVFQVVQRWMNFAIANPARQVFFTVVGREEKYKAKNLIDVVIYRGSDALYGWVYDMLHADRTQDRRHRAVRAAGGARLGRPVGDAGTHAGAPRVAARRPGARRSVMTSMTRRSFSALAAAAALAGRRVRAGQRAAAPILRAIPATGERLPAVGLGTASVFDNDDARTREAATQVVRTLLDGGGRLIDTASVLWRCGTRAGPGDAGRRRRATGSSSRPSSRRRMPRNSSAR